MAVKETKTRVMVSIPNDLLEKIDAFCAESGSSRSSYLSGLASNDLWAKYAVIEAARKVLLEQSEN